MRDYNATIEVGHRPDPGGIDPDFADTILDDLATCSPAISISERGWLEITITLPAESLVDATSSALTYIRMATARGDGKAQYPAVSVNVTTTEEYDKRNGLDVQMPDLVSVTEAAEILGVSRQAVLDRIGRHTLPATKVGREYVIRRASLSGSSRNVPLGGAAGAGAGEPDRGDAFETVGAG